MRNLKTKRLLSYDKRLKLLNTLAVSHSHSEIGQWALCKTCQDKYTQYKAEKAKLTILEQEELNKTIWLKAKGIMNAIKDRESHPTLDNKTVELDNKNSVLYD